MVWLLTVSETWQAHWNSSQHHVEPRVAAQRHSPDPETTNEPAQTCYVCSTHSWQGRRRLRRLRPVAAAAATTSRSDGESRVEQVADRSDFDVLSPRTGFRPPELVCPSQWDTAVVVAVGACVPAEDQQVLEGQTSSAAVSSRDHCRTRQHGNQTLTDWCCSAVEDSRYPPTGYWTFSSLRQPLAAPAVIRWTADVLSVDRADRQWLKKRYHWPPLTEVRRYWTQASQNHQ